MRTGIEPTDLNFYVALAPWSLAEILKSKNRGVLELLLASQKTQRNSYLSWMILGSFD